MNSLLCTISKCRPALLDGLWKGFVKCDQRSAKSFILINIGEMVVVMKFSSRLACILSLSISLYGDIRRRTGVVNQTLSVIDRGLANLDLCVAAGCEVVRLFTPLRASR